MIDNNIDNEHYLDAAHHKTVRSEGFMARIFEKSEGTATCRVDSLQEEVYSFSMAGNFDDSDDNDAGDHSRLLSEGYRLLAGIRVRRLVLDLTGLRSIDESILKFWKALDSGFSAKGCCTIMVVGLHLPAATRAELAASWKQAKTVKAAVKELRKDAASGPEGPDDVPPVSGHEFLPSGKSGPKFPFLQYKGLLLGPSFGSALVAVVALLISAKLTSLAALFGGGFFGYAVHLLQAYRRG